MRLFPHWRWSSALKFALGDWVATRLEHLTHHHTGSTASSTSDSGSLTSQEIAALTSSEVRRAPCAGGRSSAA